MKNKVDIPNFTDMFYDVSQTIHTWKINWQVLLQKEMNKTLYNIKTTNTNVNNSDFAFLTQNTNNEIVILCQEDVTNIDPMLLNCLILMNKK